MTPQFCIINNRNHRVSKIHTGLPHQAPDSAYDYILTPPESVHMLIAAEQIIEGMKSPDQAIGLQTYLLIPKRLDHTHSWFIGAEGWGIYAI